MKALIVDDEKSAVVAVRLLVDWKKHHIDTVYEVDSSEDVLPLICSEDIQLIISDVRMPGMSGLELIEEILRLRPHTKIIMISGFGQFDYVRSALQQGCVDYILKPIEEDQINAAVDKAIQAWKKEMFLQTIEHSYQELNSQMEKKQAQRLLLTCLNSAAPEIPLEELCTVLPALQRAETCRMGVIYTLHLPEEMWRGQRDLTLLADAVNDMISNRGVAVTRRLQGNIHVLLSAEMGDCFARDILDMLFQRTGICFPMGLSDEIPLEKAFPAAVNEAWERVLQYPLAELGRRQGWDKPPSERCTGVELEAFEERLYQSVFIGSNQAISECLQECVAVVVPEDTVSIGRLEKLRYDYLNMRIRWVEGFRLNLRNTNRKVNPPEVQFFVPFTDTGEFSLRMLEQGMLDDLKKLSKSFLEIMGGKDSDTIFFQRIEQFLIRNYTQKISLRMVSDEFAVSESYLSRTFKKKIGIGINEYVNLLRIQRAKELLVNPHVRMADISYLLGYSDEKYFSRVFRKLEGISPQAYRARHMRGGPE